VLFTGDLGSSRAQNGVEIARSLARIQRRVFVMFGNNDAAEYARIAAELRYQAGRADLLSGMDRDCTTTLNSAPTVCGFSAHELNAGGERLTLIGARPFAMGGNALAFYHALKASYGIESMVESTARLIRPRR